MEQSGTESVAEHPLRIARNAAGLTRRNLARLIGVHENTLYAYENWRQRPSEESLQALRAALGEHLEKAERELGQIETRQPGRPSNAA